jgi:DNA-binding response OmpR family regulator
MALDMNDTPLIRDAIDALSQTTGGANLFASGARQPLLDAIAYPDRRVQYEAALTLARALPDRRFEGDYRIVPVLASAVRTGAVSYAAVVSDDDENRRNLVNALEGLDFEVIGAESSLAAMAGAVAEAPGIDLIVVRMGSDTSAMNVITNIRREAKTAASPVAVFASGVDVGSLREEYLGQAQIQVGRPPLGEQATDARITALLNRAVGGRLTEGAAEAYAFDALAALERVAISCSPAFNVADAEFSLLEALNDRTGRARMLVADILAYIDSEVAQQSLLDAALNEADPDDQIDLLERVAVSVKRNGNKAAAHQVASIVDLVESSAGDTADAAGKVHGAMNLSATEAVGLIQGLVDGD